MDLAVNYTVYSVATKGRNSPHEVQYITLYRLACSHDGSTWTYISYSEYSYVFPGNFDRSTAVRHELSEPVEARHFLVEIVAFNLVWPAFRWELYGFESSLLLNAGT